MTTIPVPPDTLEFNRAARTFAIANLYRNTSEFPVWAWPTLTNAVGPLVPGTLVVLGGYTGNGKTAMLLNLARSLLSQSVGWAYVGLELADYMLVQLLAALDCNLARWSIIEGATTPAEKAVMLDIIKGLRQYDPLMHFLPDPTVSAQDLVASIHALHAERKVRVVVLDHLHHLNYDESPNIRRAVSQAVRLLKETARQLDITIIVSAQLRRESQDKAQGYRIPGLSELAESGTIEQVADIVLMAHRQIMPGCAEKLRAYQKGDPTVREEDFAMPKRLGVTIRKHRFGRPIGVTIPLTIHTPSDRITDALSEPWDRGDAYE